MFCEHARLILTREARESFREEEERSSIISEQGKEHVGLRKSVHTHRSEVLGTESCCLRCCHVTTTFIIVSISPYHCTHVCLLFFSN